jgi:peptidoglycan hydrolase-like protein with peptidoglycan-binding domain
MIKKYILGALIALSLPTLFAYAATPNLVVSGNGDNNNVTLTVTGGEPNAPVVLFYNPTTAGTVQQRSVGYTDANGYWNGSVSTSALGATWNTPVYVQVAGYQSLPSNWSSTGTVSAPSISFSQSSPVIGVGQNGAITLSGGNGGTYYVSSNSNTTGISPVISGNTLTVYGSQAGSGNIVVCSTGGGCGTVSVSVNGNGGTTSSSSGSPMLSQSLLNVNQNGQGTITLSGGSGPYSVSVPAGSGITTTMVGNTLYINGGSNTGVNTVQVCSANNQGCTPVTVNVQSAGTATTSTPSTGGTLSFALPINVGSPTQLTLTGGSGSYYLATPMASPALASISGNTLTLNGSVVGSGTVTVCSTSGGNCLPIAVTVSPALTGTGGGYFFDFDLSLGMTSQDVMELQSRLASEGYFQAAPTGYFGPITMAAVQSYQRAHGISATGYVGPLTRAELNK